MWKLNFSIHALIATVSATLKCLDLEPGILNEFCCWGLKYTNYFIIFSQQFIYGGAYRVLSELIWTLSTKLHSQSQKSVFATANTCSGITTWAKESFLLDYHYLRPQKSYFIKIYAVMVHVICTWHCFFDTKSSFIFYFCQAFLRTIKCLWF